MKKTIFTVFLCFVLNSIVAHGLMCNSGYKIIYSPYLRSINIRTLQCASNAEQKCLRIEAKAEIFGQRATVMAGGCASLARCEVECETLLAEALEEEVFEEEITATNCSRMCCQTDNCNVDEIDVVRESQVTNSTTTTTTTTTANPPITLPVLSSSRTCRNGVSNLASGESNVTENWLCPTSSNFCLRQEVTTITANGETVKYDISSCASESTCMESCSAVAREIIGHPAPSIRSCTKACCNLDECNFLSVKDMQGVFNSIALTFSSSTTGAQSFPTETTMAASSTTTTSVSTTTLTKNKTEASAITTDAQPILSASTISGITFDQSSARQELETTYTPSTQHQQTVYVETLSEEDLAGASLTTFSISPTQITTVAFQPDTTKRETSTTDEPSTDSAMHTSVGVEESDTTNFTKSPTLPSSQSPQRISCSHIYDISDPVEGYTSYAYFDPVDCPVNVFDRCLRQKFLVELPSGMIVTVIAGVCANKSTCMDSCANVAGLLSRQGVFSGSVIGTTDLTSQPIASCVMECCQSNRCNEDPIPGEDRNIYNILKSTTLNSDDGGSGAVVKNNQCLTIFALVLTLIVPLFS